MNFFRLPVIFKFGVKKSLTVQGPGNFNGQRSLAGCSPWSCKRVRYNLATKNNSKQCIYIFNWDVIESTIQNEYACVVLDESFIAQIFICSYSILITEFTVLLSNMLGSEDDSDMDNPMFLSLYNFQSSQREIYVNK